MDMRNGIRLLQCMNCFFIKYSYIYKYPSYLCYKYFLQNQLRDKCKSTHEHRHAQVNSMSTKATNPLIFYIEPINVELFLSFKIVVM